MKDSMGFFFMLKNISLDNQPVDFIEAADTVVIDDITILNKYLVSEPFTLQDNSEFNFTITYGITDSAVSEQLGENDLISYKLELADENTKEALGNLVEIAFNKNNLTFFNEEVFIVNTNRIKSSRQVVLKIIAENNFNGEYILTESYTDMPSDGLAKTNIKKIDYKSFLPIMDYALSQNYPNPFNPSTIINYQIPHDGLVTLKIYDVLGKELKTLVNEYKSLGRYEVKFDASNLSSGVYLYQLKVNDYLQSKKMLLVK